MTLIELPRISATFPVWERVDHRDGWLKLTCPRCGETTYVHGKRWRTTLDTATLTRPCPYCFKVSRMDGPVIEHREVTSSDGFTIYVVSVRDGKPESCTCPGYSYRTACRHMAEAA
jgi:hypothetical protein